MYKHLFRTDKTTVTINQDSSTWEIVAGNMGTVNYPLSSGKKRLIPYPLSFRGMSMWKDSNYSCLVINNKAKVRNAYGACMNAFSVSCKGFTLMTRLLTIQKGVIVVGGGMFKLDRDIVDGFKVRGRLMTNNEVVVNGGDFAGVGTFSRGNIAGAWADNDIDGDMNVSSNIVRITGGINIGNVYGGRAYKGIVSSNTVTISSSVKIGNSVYGGYIVLKGTATENTVNLTSVTVGSDVFGGKIGRGLASSNTVTIISGTVRNVCGGYIVKNGTATENKVNLTSVTVRLDVYGARVRDGLASSNTVTITSGTVRNIFGGCIVEKGTATENTVNLTSVTVKLDVYGAWIRDGLASSNTVTITSGTVRNVFGGYIHQNGTATLNTVNLTSVTVKLDVYGAWIRDGLASSNTVTITSGKVRIVCGGYIHQNGTATLNKVNLISGTVRMDVYGALIGKAGDVSSNTVTITSGTVGQNVYGGYIVKNGTATGNKVNLTDVEVTRDVYGAKIGRGLASSNEVTITGRRVGGDVLGGYVYNDGTATGNKVNLTDVEVTRDVFGAMVGTDKKAEFERAMEEATEAYERFLACTAKQIFDMIEMDKAKKAEFKKRITDEFKETVGAIRASERALSHLAKAVFERAGKAEKSKFEEAEEAIIGAKNVVRDLYSTIGEFTSAGEAGRAEIKTKTKPETKEAVVKEKIEKFKAKRAEFKKYVIARIERAEAERAKTYVLASSNTVTITSGTVGRDVYGGYIHQNGTATLNTVNLTSVTATKDVDGAWIGGDGLASSNTVTITSGTVGLNVYGGYIVNNGTATGNTVTISGGKVKGNVFGGYVGGKGEATYNTINIIASTEFSPESILCGGICADADKNDAITGNTLNIETKRIEVKGISNFEKYKFHLKDIKAGETILTATSGGCSWNTREHNYTSDCAVDISRSNMNISLHTQGVLNKSDQYTLIKSPHGFKGKVETKQIDFENEGLLIKYYWDIKIADNKQELIAKLIDKKIRDGGVARSLSEGYGAGVVCVNNGMDCIFSKMEETEEQSPKSLLGEGTKLGAKLPGKGEIGVFCGLAANKSSYNTGLHIDMIGTSMMGGVGKVVEVREKELTVGVFVEHGTGNSDIQKLSFSGLCPCKKESKGTSSYIGGGLLGRYNIYENEFSGTKLYGEAILRAGQASTNFDGNEIKNLSGKEIKYEMDALMYGGCAVGGGYKHKVSEKIDLDWSLRYMFGYQDGKGAKQADVDGNKAKFESVTSNRIRIGVRGKYVELEKIKPYAGIGCECELSVKVKGAIQNGVDMIDMPVSDFGGVTGIGELGVSGKIWKFGVDISGQGYLGVRKGFGGMLKLKYAFGKDAHGSLASRQGKRKD